MRLPTGMKGWVNVLEIDSYVNLGKRNNAIFLLIYQISPYLGE